MVKSVKVEKLSLKTKDLHVENISKLSELFPQLLTEMEIEETDSEGKNVKKIIKTFDSEKLKELVGDYAKKDSEIYELTWAGKQDSKRKIAEPITKTLRPIKKDSVDFENTGNLYIEGDNFEVLKLLQNPYVGKIKMIYIDPPYNTGKDFVYKDNYSMSREEHNEESGVVDNEGNKLIKNTIANGRFHSDWISMMYERLVLARDLLKNEGIIFISIGDNEVANLKKICDEVFGEVNFYGQLSWINRTKPKNMGDARFKIQQNTEYILAYGKQSMTEYSGFNLEPLELKKYPLKDAKGNYRTESLDQRRNFGTLRRDTMVYPVLGISPKEGFRWQLSQNEYQELKKEGKIRLINNKPHKIIYDFDEEAFSYNPFWSLLEDTGTAEDGKKELTDVLGKDPGFETVKPLNLLKKLISYTIKKDSNEYVLDFFAGSGTTAHAVLELNRDGGNIKFICVQLQDPTPKDSESFKAGYKDICEIGKERIKRAAKKIKDELKEINKQQKLDGEKIDVDSLDFGFKVFRIDESNMKDVYYHPSQVTQAKLDGLADNIKEDRSPEDLLYQVLLDLAIPISAKVTEEKIDNKKVFRVEDNFLIACFDSDVSLDLVKKIAEAKPERLVFRDSSFKDDKEKVNCGEFLKHSLPNTIIKVI